MTGQEMVTSFAHLDSWSIDVPCSLGVNACILSWPMRLELLPWQSKGQNTAETIDEWTERRRTKGEVASPQSKLLNACSCQCFEHA